MRLVALIIELLTVAMLALAAAALWAYAALLGRGDAAWMAAVLTLGLPLVLRTGGLLPGWRPLASAVLMLSTLALSSAALGLTRLALAVGMRPDEVWARIDWGTMLDLTRKGFSPGLLPWLLLAVPAAALVSVLLERPRKR